MTHRRPPSLRRAALLAALLAAAAPARAGDLNAEVNAMFNSLGTLGNYTAPGAFKGQTYNTYAGGSVYLRSPTRTYQLTSIALPDASGGCGGINVFGGSFSHISATEFKNMLQNITAALPGIAFQLALETVSPLLGGLTKWAKSFENFVNNARINSCETAKALVAAAADRAGFRSDDACAGVAQMLGAPEPDQPFQAGARRPPQQGAVEEGAAEGDEMAARKGCARGLRQFREAQAEVGQRHVAARAAERIQQPSDQYAERAQHRQRQQVQQPEQAEQKARKHSRLTPAPAAAPRRVAPCSGCNPTGIAAGSCG